MEFIVIVGAVLLVVFVFRKYTRPTSSDKLTLLQLENWVSIYSSGSLFEKSNMATALVVQSIIMSFPRFFVFQRAGFMLPVFHHAER